MLSEERRNLLLQLLKEKKNIQIIDISKKTNFSISTIRRDLDILSKKGLIKRVHGGAQSFETGIWNDLYINSMNKNLQEKVIICNEAIKFINDYDVIFIDAGTTFYPLINNLKNIKGLTLITNSLYIPLVMEKINKSTNIIVTGGVYNSVSHSLNGEISVSSLKQVRIGKAFLSSMAIDNDIGITDPNPDEVLLKKEVLESARIKIFCVDYTKFGRIAPYQLCQLKDIDIIISDYRIDKTIVKKIENIGVKIILGKYIPNDKNADAEGNSKISKVNEDFNNGKVIDI